MKHSKHMPRKRTGQQRAGLDMYRSRSIPKFAPGCTRCATLGTLPPASHSRCTRPHEVLQALACKRLFTEVVPAIRFQPAWLTSSDMRLLLARVVSASTFTSIATPLTARLAAVCNKVSCHLQVCKRACKTMPQQYHRFQHAGVAIISNACLHAWDTIMLFWAEKMASALRSRILLCPGSPWGTVVRPPFIPKALSCIHTTTFSYDLTGHSNRPVNRLHALSTLWSSLNQSPPVNACMSTDAQNNSHAPPAHSTVLLIAQQPQVDVSGCVRGTCKRKVTCQSRKHDRTDGTHGSFMLKTRLCVASDAKTT